MPKKSSKKTKKSKKSSKKTKKSKKDKKIYCPECGRLVRHKLSEYVSIDGNPITRYKCRGGHHWETDEDGEIISSSFEVEEEEEE